MDVVGFLQKPINPRGLAIFLDAADGIAHGANMIVAGGAAAFNNTLEMGTGAVEKFREFVGPKETPVVETQVARGISAPAQSAPSPNEFCPGDLCTLSSPSFSVASISAGGRSV